MQNFKILDFDVFILDCDGVILDSNDIKSNAFYKVALRFGNEVASDFLSYHKKNGGISRYKKFKYLLENILQEQLNDTTYNKLILDYSSVVKKSLESTNLTSGALEFLTLLTNNKKKIYVCSGGDQLELNDVFRTKKLDKFFMKIYGSPSDKYSIVDEILDREKILPNKCLYIGDSILDKEVAINKGLRYLYMTDYTDNPEGLNKDIADNGHCYILNFRDLLERGEL